MDNRRDCRELDTASIVQRYSPVIHTTVSPDTRGSPQYLMTLQRTRDPAYETQEAYRAAMHAWHSCSSTHTHQIPTLSLEFALHYPTARLYPLGVCMRFINTSVCGNTRRCRRAYFCFVVPCLALSRFFMTLPCTVSLIDSRTLYTRLISNLMSAERRVTATTRLIFTG